MNCNRSLAKNLEVVPSSVVQRDSVSFESQVGGPLPRPGKFGFSFSLIIAFGVGAVQDANHAEGYGVEGDMAYRIGTFANTIQFVANYD